MNRFTFQTSPPIEDGWYVAYSDHPDRISDDEMPSLYLREDNAWKHYTGLYDNAITHWMKIDLK